MRTMHGVVDFAAEERDGAGQVSGCWPLEGVRRKAGKVGSGAEVRDGVTNEDLDEDPGDRAARDVA